MKRIRLMSAARGLAALTLLWGGQLLSPTAVMAQERENETVESGRVVVEMKDGKVFVNGKETEVGENGRLVLRTGDGDHIVVVTDEDGPVWYSAVGVGARARADAERAREMARMAYRLHAPDRDHNEFVMEFEPPDLSGLEDLEFDVDVEGQLDDVFEHVDGLRGNMFRLRMQSEELRELESEIRSKAREIRRAEDDESAALEAELDDLLNQAFELKLQAEQKNLAEMEEHITELQHRIQERETNRHEIMDRRKKELLGRHDDLDW